MEYAEARRPAPVVTVEGFQGLLTGELNRMIQNHNGYSINPRYHKSKIAILMVYDDSAHEPVAMVDITKRGVSIKGFDETADTAAATLNDLVTVVDLLQERTLARRRIPVTH